LEKRIARTLESVPNLFWRQNKRTQRCFYFWCWLPTK